MPERTCVGCRKKCEKDELIRFAYYNGVMSFDREWSLPGRGAYLCRDDACLEKAIKNKGFSRTFKARVSPEEVRHCYEEYGKEGA